MQSMKAYNDILQKQDSLLGSDGIVEFGTIPPNLNESISYGTPNAIIKEGDIIKKKRNGKLIK